MSPRARPPIPVKAKKVADPVALTLQTIGLRWIRIAECKPPLFVEFFGLYKMGPGDDYKIDHCLFDGSGQEGHDKLYAWWPAPLLPKGMTQGFPPYEGELGKELKASIEQWLKDLPAP